MKPKTSDKNVRNKSLKRNDSSKEFLKDPNILESTYEKVLRIINNVKEFIKKNSKSSQKLVEDLEWVIKVIANKSLYSLEVNKTKLISKNSEVNRFLSFVTKYNEEVIELNSKHILVSSIFNLSKKDILLKPSLCLKKILPDELKNMDYQKEKEINERKRRSIFSIGKIFLNLYYRGLEQQKKEKEEKEKAEKEKKEKEKKQEKEKTPKKIKSEKEAYLKKEKTIKTEKTGQKLKSDRTKKINLFAKKDSKTKTNILNNISNSSLSFNKPQNLKRINTNKMNSNRISINDTDKLRSLDFKNRVLRNRLNDQKKDNYNHSQLTLNKKLTLNSIKKAMQNYYITQVHYLDLQRVKTNKSGYSEKVFASDKNTQTALYKRPKKKILVLSEEQAYVKINNSKPKNSQIIKNEERIPINSLVDKYFNELKEVIDKDFDIIEFKNKVGYKNVLPLVCHVILKTLGLIDKKVISTSKLGSFLYKVSDSYLESTLYHNALHGSDVTQSLCVYLINSNAEQISETTVLDLLGLVVSAMGHDLGHPGYNNNFHVNAYTELALTYNDASCLENFHTSFLFKILRKDENNILEKFSKQNFKSIRKRMIGQILATDMANHVEVISKIRAKIKTSQEELGDNNFSLLSGNEKSQFEEQQTLFNYLIHAADLGHNCKKFKISIKWVEILSNEFWIQGDMEKKKGIPVSFLCDRDVIDVPASQVSFLRGFIISTFDCLVTMFPNLKYNMENAENNIKQWQLLRDQKRARGWTPEKDKKDAKNKDENNDKKEKNNKN